MLDKIINKKQQRVAYQKKLKPLTRLKRQVAEEIKIEQRDFRGAMDAGKKIHIIGELKKASPSKGVLCDPFAYLDYAVIYNTGVEAISVLTEEDFFLGSPDYLSKVKEIVTVPLLRKDFIIDEYQIFESKLLGADAILLITSLLSSKQLKEYLQLASALGLSSLVEVHDKEEILIALQAGAEIIGVNNRDLKTFHVDVERTLSLLPYIPNEIIVVSESGLHNRHQIEKLEQAGVKGVLIGETLMKSQDISFKLKELRGFIDES